MSGVGRVKEIIGLGDEPDNGASLAISRDDLLTAVAEKRRAFVISQLAHLNDDEHLTVNQLAEGMAYFENDDIASLEDVSTTERKRCYVSLYQTHLPRLAILGIVDYDQNLGHVRPTVGTDAAYRVVQAAEKEVANGGMAR